MRNLLSANFSRLGKNRLFWVCLIGVFGFSAAVSLYEVHFNTVRRVSLGFAPYEYGLEDITFNFVPFLGLFVAVFTAMFLGTEYADGTLRNKLIVGHRRADIYLANFIVCAVGGVALVLAWFLGGLTAAPFMGLWAFGVQKGLLCLLIVVLFTVSFVALFTLIGMLSSNKATTVAVTVVLFVVMLIVSSSLINRLSQPESIYDYVLSEDGELVMLGMKPNPSAVTGTMRVVFQGLANILPAAQSLQIATLDIPHPEQQLLSSLGLILFSVVVGLMLFKRKDLK